MGQLQVEVLYRQETSTITYGHWQIGCHQYPDERTVTKTCGKKLLSLTGFQ